MGDLPSATTKISFCLKVIELCYNYIDNRMGNLHYFSFMVSSLFFKTTCFTFHIFIMLKSNCIMFVFKA